MNVVCLLGRLTQEPELRQTPNGTSVCSFSIAVNRQFASQDGTRQADFINCVAWRQTGEFISKYFHKGSMIGINGSIQTRQYQDKDTGKNRTAFEIVVSNAHFAESKGSGTSMASPRPNNTMNAPSFEQNNQPSSFSTGDFDDFTAIASDEGDLPF